KHDPPEFVGTPYWCVAAVTLLIRKMQGSDEVAIGDYLRRRQGLENATAADGAPPVTQVKWLYEILTVLDNKASALMRLNSVMLAAAAFLLRPVEKPGQIPAMDVRLLLIALLSSISIALCLLIVSVDWGFLGLAREDGAGLNFDREIANLQQCVAF